MTPRRSRWLLSAVVVVGVIGALGVRLSLPKRPSYQGRSLDAWIDLYSQAQSRRTDDWEADLRDSRAALRAMGPEALPLLLDDLAVRRPPWYDAALHWLARNLHTARLHPPRIEDRWIRGVWGLEALGTNAAPALPRLIADATNHPPYSLHALMAVGEPALSTVTNLLETSAPAEVQELLDAFSSAISRQNLSPEAAAAAVPSLLVVFRTTTGNTRNSAASCLINLHQRPDLCLPVFTESLGDASPHVRKLSALALGVFGEGAAVFLPRLVELFETGDATARATACTALGWIRAPAAQTVPLLLRGARDPESSVRAAAVAGMGHPRGATDLTLPAIARGLADSDTGVRYAALHAFESLGSNAIPCEPLLRRLAEDPEDPVSEIAAFVRRKVLGLPAGIPSRKLARPPFPAPPHEPPDTPSSKSGVRTEVPAPGI